MTRAPVAAWRTLFAIGGAPAASHAALCRAPSSDRLLDPLRDARVVNDTSLEALARPIDVAGVLSSVVDAVNAAEAPSADSIDGPVPRARSAPTPMSEQRRRAVTLEPTASPPGGSLLPADNSISSSSPTWRMRTRVHEEPSRRHDLLNSSSVQSLAFVRRDLSPEASVGARARVMLESPIPRVERLLALGATAIVSSRPPKQTVPPAISKSSSTDIGRLLADAVNRVNAMKGEAGAIASSRTVQSPVAAPPRSASNVQPLASTDRDSVLVSERAVASTEGSGGFRGLAQRTLGQQQSAERVRTSRIEPEIRTPSDLETDSLDARVADSLARVIEREARRQGINVSEIGA